MSRPENHYLLSVGKYNIGPISLISPSLRHINVRTLPLTNPPFSVPRHLKSAANIRDHVAPVDYAQSNRISNRGLKGHSTPEAGIIIHQRINCYA